MVKLKKCRFASPLDRRAANGPCAVGRTAPTPLSPATHPLPRRRRLTDLVVLSKRIIKDCRRLTDFGLPATTPLRFPGLETGRLEKEDLKGAAHTQQRPRPPRPSGPNPSKRPSTYSVERDFHKFFTSSCRRSQFFDPLLPNRALICLPLHSPLPTSGLPSSIHPRERVRPQKRPTLGKRSREPKGKRHTIV